ncbi:solute carrier family 52, riboflavin transporter, member 3-A [Microcaecilia unicolor]|uniref:Riboflavin transporter n=1 Tax=Microcaecilia unicolor TaxID=1415580 RepID=A0A6P7XQQ4_9AMPH|nr:solute carrier family 52, riboflavin transporter, member 3 [Microcaecilia unicolor]XP_030054858.1 solute carrier family 52, riboflavin transporter, member 3 [Microcaecilia unicolor]XP_030054859.1 solute carrier family 52, riboflavin transporter, member 3 [Microcaecilia unicolor]
MDLLVHLLACIFGTGSWVAINGLWVELPLLVSQLPEGWYLPSYLTVIIQMANVGPLFVTLMHRFKPGKLNEVIVIYGIVILGILACLLLGFFWQRTTMIGGVLHSTAFLIITFFLSMVDCTSSVTFLPFMMRLQPKYITTYFIGEGLSGFLPGIIALAQGAGMVKCVNASQTLNSTVGNSNDTSGFQQMETQYLPPNFSTEIFFFLLAAMMVFCLVAFFFLTRVPTILEISRENLVASSVNINSSETTTRNDSSTLGPDPDRNTTEHNEGAADTQCKEESYTISQLVFIYLLVVWVNSLTNGILPSVQTYSCMPYGSMAYHLCATLSSMANPLACFIAMFVPRRSLLLLGVLALVGTSFGMYNMAMAALSPCPLLQHSDWGDVLIVISWVLFTGTLSYVKVMIGIILRDQNYSALVWCGAAVQLGSLVGALVMFPVVSVYNVFKSSDCNTKCSF